MGGACRGGRTDGEIGEACEDRETCESRDAGEDEEGRPALIADAHEPVFGDRLLTKVAMWPMAEKVFRSLDLQCLRLHASSPPTRPHTARDVAVADSLVFVSVGNLY